MGRRTSGAVVGLEKIGLVQASASTLTTTQTNTDLTLDPNGTGTVIVDSAAEVRGDLTLTNQSDLRLREASANGTNYIAMQAAANMANNYTITWPSAVAGTSGFVLSSDTSGNLSWVSQTTAGVSSSDPGASATIFYPFFGTNSGSIPTGQLTALSVRSNLSFQPSTGTLAATIQQAPDIIGSTATSGTLTLRGTTNATKFTGAGGSIRMTDNVTSSGTTTGTLVVTGGVGISGALNVGGAITSNSATVLTTSNRPALGTNGIIRTNSNTISENITIPSGTCGMTAGPVTIGSGFTVTVTGDWSVV